MIQNYWTIQKKDGQRVGPLSSSEVRESLRKGSIDLFDWIYKESSNLTVRIIDVDEIFKTDSDQSDSVYDDMNSLAGSTNTQPNAKAAVDQTQAPVNEGNSLKKNKEEAYHSYVQPNRAANQSANNDISVLKEKKYYLSTRTGSQVGPVNVFEIISRYQKKPSSRKRIYVSLANNNIRIPIIDFVQTYNKYHSSSAKDVMLTNLFKERKSSKNLDLIQSQLATSPIVRHQASASSSSKLLIAVAIVGIIIIAGILIYPRTNLDLSKKAYVFSSLLSKQDEQKNISIQSVKPKVKDLPKIVSQPISEPKVKPKEPAATTTPTEPTNTVQQEPPKVAKQEPVEKPKSAKKVTKKIPVEPKPKKVEKVSPPPAQPKPTYVSTPVKQPKVQNKVEPEVQQPKPRYNQRTVAVATPTPTRPIQKSYQRPPVSEPKVPRLVAGSVVTLPNMSFSQVELNTCPAKCTLNFHSPKLTIRGSFFKAAYASSLKNKSKVTITGTVSINDSGYGMIIQNVE